MFMAMVRRLCLLTPVAAWLDSGHLLVAEMARRQLTDELETLNLLLNSWNMDFPHMWLALGGLRHRVFIAFYRVLA